MTTRKEAIDQIFGRFKAVWEAQSAAIVGTVPLIIWQGNEPKEPTPIDNYWCRVSIKTVLEPQAALSNFVANPGQSLYNPKGLLFIQLFCPMAKANAWDKGNDLAIIARNAFRGYQTSGSVWFNNVTITELAPEDSMYRFNIVADFQYNDIG